MSLKLILLVCILHQVVANIYTVRNGYGELSKVVGLCKLQQCTIVIDKKEIRFPSEITLNSGNITFKGKQQPNGKYPVLNGQKMTRLFTISAIANFQGLVLKNGKAADYGGALDIFGGSVEFIRNCTFKGNSAGEVSFFLNSFIFF